MYKKYSRTDERLTCKNKTDTRGDLFDYGISRIITIDLFDENKSPITYCFSCNEIQEFKENLRKGEDVYKKWRLLHKDIPQIKNSQIDMLLDKEDCELEVEDELYYEDMLLESLRRGDVKSAEQIYQKYNSDMDFENNKVRKALELAYDKDYKKIISLLLQHDELKRYIIKDRPFIANTKDKINKRCTPRQDVITLRDLNTLKEVVTIKLEDGSYVCYSPGEAKLLKSILKKNNFEKLKMEVETQLPVRDTYKLLKAIDEINNNNEINYLPDEY
jgi:hypothetical protein